jgi:hypothetical protein
MMIRRWKGTPAIVRPDAIAHRDGTNVSLRPATGDAARGRHELPLCFGSHNASMDQGGIGHGRCAELECRLGVEPAIDHAEVGLFASRTSTAFSTPRDLRWRTYRVRRCFSRATCSSAIAPREVAAPEFGPISSSVHTRPWRKSHY